MKPQREAFAFTVAVLVTVGGCTSPPTDASKELHHVPGPGILRSMVSIPGNNHTETLTPVNSNTHIGPIGIGSFPRLTLLRVQASGAITPYVNFGSPPPGGYKGTNIDGSYNPGGFWASGACQANVVLGFSISGGFGFCNSPGTGDADLDRAILAQGDGTVMWNRGNTYGHWPECAIDLETPCYLYSDGTSFTVTIDKIPAQATLLPDEVVVDSGDAVTFLASIAPAIYDGVPVPFQFLSSWKFQPDGGGPQQSVCLPGPQCVMTATVSGTVMASVNAQGDSVMLTGHITVDTCPPVSDSVVNDPNVRQGLRHELDLSRPNPNGTGRMERFGWIFRRADGTMYTEFYQGPATECSITPQPPTMHPGTTIVGAYHTHPSKLNELYNTPGCIAKGKPSPFANGGGSKVDWDFTDNPNWGNVPMYIISAAGAIFRLTPGTPKKDRPKNPHKWRFNPADPNSCLALIP